MPVSYEINNTSNKPATPINNNKEISKNRPQAVETVTENTSGANFDGLTVALLVPQSGKNQVMGNNLAQSAALSLSRLPQQNRINLQIIDSTPLSATTVKEIATKIINNGTDLIIGPVFGKQAEILQQELAKNTNAPPIITYSNTASVAKPNLYIAGFDPFVEVISTATALATSGNCYVVVTNSDATGYAMDEKIKKSLQDNNAKTIGTFYYQSATAQDLANNIKTTAEQTTNCPATASGATVTTILALSGDNLKNLMMILNNVRTDIIAPSSEYSTTQVVYFADVDRIKRQNIENYYKNTLSRMPTRLDIITYDMVSLAGYLSQDSVKDGSAIYNPAGFQGIVGLFRFNQNGTIQRALSIYKNQSGIITEVKGAENAF